MLVTRSTFVFAKSNARGKPCREEMSSRALSPNGTSELHFCTAADAAQMRAKEQRNADERKHQRRHPGSPVERARSDEHDGQHCMSNNRVQRKFAGQPREQPVRRHERTQPSRLQIGAERNPEAEHRKHQIQRRGAHLCSFIEGLA